MVVSAPMAQAPLVTFVPPVVEPPTLQEALQPLSDLIALGESSTAGDYNAANNGRAMDLGKHGLSNLFGRNCSEVTIGEVMLAQAQHRLHAVGRYQIIGTTLTAAVRWAGLSGADTFSPANQDKLFIALIKFKRPAVWSFLAHTGSIDRAANALAREWSSLPAPWGGSYYGAGDRAHVSRAQVLSALQASEQAMEDLA